MDILTANDKVGEYPASYYAAAATPLNRFAKAEGDLSCDICVVGAGFTGLSTALHLAQKGYDVVLLDAHRVGWGASGRNGGQVSVGQRVAQDTLERIVGKPRARDLWELGLQSVALLRRLIDDHDMDCRFVNGIIEADHRKRFVPHSHAYVEKLQTEYGYDQIRCLDQQEIRHLVGTSAYYGGALDMGSGHINPLSFSLGLARAAAAKGVRIFEKSKVTQLTETSPAIVKTETATITASHVVLACNGYLGRLDNKTAARVMPINNFIIATEPMEEEQAESIIRNNYAVADSKFVINYYRFSEDRRLLFGGGESYGYRFPKDITATVRKPMLEIYPQLRDTRIDHAWGGTLGITMSRLPYFERITGNIISAGGYSGQGVALGTLAGQIIAQAIAGQAEKFDMMASVPTHRFPGGPAMRTPLLVLAMLWFSLRDKL